MGRISERQKTRFIDLMSRNYKILFGRFLSASGVDLKTVKWRQIMDELNNLGSEKTLDQWKKCWADLKKGARDKLMAIRRYRNLTGGGSPGPTTLTDQDQIIINICGIEGLDGISGDELGAVEELGADAVSGSFSQISTRSDHNRSSISGLSSVTRRNARLERDGTISRSTSASLPIVNSVVSHSFSRPSHCTYSGGHHSSSRPNSSMRTESDAHVAGSSSSRAAKDRDTARHQSISTSNDRESSRSTSTSKSYERNRSIHMPRNSGSNGQRSRSRSNSIRSERNEERSTHQRPGNAISTRNRLSSGHLLSTRIGMPWSTAGLRIDSDPSDQRSRSRQNSITISERNEESSTYQRPGSAVSLRNCRVAGLSSSGDGVASLLSSEAQSQSDASSRPRAMARTDRSEARYRAVSLSNDRERSRSISTSGYGDINQSGSTLGNSRNNRMSSSRPTYHSVSRSYRSRSRSNSITRSDSRRNRSTSRTNSTTRSVSRGYRSRSRTNSMTRSVTSSFRTEFRIPDRPGRRNLTGTVASNVEEAARVQKNIERKVSQMCDKQDDTVDVMKDVLLELRHMRASNR